MIRKHIQLNNGVGDEEAKGLVNTTKSLLAAMVNGACEKNERLALFFFGLLRFFTWIRDEEEGPAARTEDMSRRVESRGSGWSLEDFFQRENGEFWNGEGGSPF